MIGSHAPGVRIAYALAGVILAALLQNLLDAPQFEIYFNIGFAIMALLVLRNPNVLSVVLIILAARLSQDLFWYLPDSPLLKVISYFLAIGVGFWLRYDITGKGLLVLVSVVISAEVYWIIINYEAPSVYWEVLLATYMVFLRHVFLLRPIYLSKKIKQQVATITIDYYMRTYMLLFFLLYFCGALEYLIRHTTSFTPLLVYESKPILILGVNITIFIVVVWEQIKSIQSRHLKA